MYNNKQIDLISKHKSRKCFAGVIFGVWSSMSTDFSVANLRDLIKGRMKWN